MEVTGTFSINDDGCRGARDPTPPPWTLSSDSFQSHNGNRQATPGYGMTPEEAEKQEAAILQFMRDVFSVQQPRQIKHMSPELNEPVDLSSGELNPEEEVSNKINNRKAFYVHRHSEPWTAAMRVSFLIQVKRLGGVLKATPKPILEAMNVPGLTRSSVSSHLQKHRDRFKGKKRNRGRNH
jgi:SHAQKYF class myb-like DNA-binding protein